MTAIYIHKVQYSIWRPLKSDLLVKDKGGAEEFFWRSWCDSLKWKTSKEIGKPYRNRMCRPYIYIGWRRRRRREYSGSIRKRLEEENGIKHQKHDWRHCHSCRLFGMLDDGEDLLSTLFTSRYVEKHTDTHDSHTRVDGTRLDRKATAQLGTTMCVYVSI